MTDERPAMRAHIAVPATCANLGPGFDILAVALELQNEVDVEQTGGAEISVDPGAGAPPELHDPARNLVTRAYALACEAAGVEAPGARFICHNRIPFRRGLGSSSAAALGGVLACVALHRPPWDGAQILSLVTEFEGHPDNAAAAMHGGLTIVAPGAEPRMLRVDEELHVVLFIPDVELATDEARGVIPDGYTRADAVFNAARCALLVRAVAERDWGSLRDAMDDRWHQPQRTALMPWLPDLIAAANTAGACGACLSGAGPSVLAFTPIDPAPVERGLVAAAAAHGLGGRTLVSRVRNYGARVDSGLRV